MKTAKYFYTLILTLSLIGSITAQDIITVDELANISQNKDLIIISCQKPADYQKKHLPNSINLDHTDLYVDGPVKGMLKPNPEIARILGSKGITNEKTIVLYDEGTYKYASRVYWILDYMGIENKKILDGQMMALRRAKMQFTAAPSNIEEGNFIAKVDTNKIATMIHVREAQQNPNAIIIDAREAKEYNGLSETKDRKGHIPGAINIPFEEVLTGKRKLKSAQDLEDFFKAKGINSENEIIVYCESGVRASVLYFALHSGLSYPNVRLYDGAYLEWQSVADNPVELSR